MIRRHLILSAAVFVLIVLFQGVSWAQEWTGNINLFLGGKSLNEGDWAPTDEQSEAGVEIDFKRKDWPVSVAVDIMGSKEKVFLEDPGGETVEVVGRTSEIDIGVKKIWENTPAVRPFIGGGLAVVSAEQQTRTYFPTAKVSDDDTELGVWFGGGVYWTLREHLNLGLEAKFSAAEVELFSKDVDAGGTHFGLILGYHW